MNTPAVSAGAGDPDAPIANFSQCHVGIVGQLDALGELPALLAPAARARRVAADTLAFFDTVVLEHHAQEERELFPAVQRSATRGAEQDQVGAIVERLTAEHRQVEDLWATLKPDLKRVAKGLDAALDADTLTQLVRDYRAHARFEEEVFLPLSQTVLGRDANHMAALGLSLHMRHLQPAVGHI